MYVESSTLYLDSNWAYGISISRVSARKSTHVYTKLTNPSVDRSIMSACLIKQTLSLCYVWMLKF